MWRVGWPWGSRNLRTKNAAYEAMMTASAGRKEDENRWG